MSEDFVSRNEFNNLKAEVLQDLNHFLKLFKKMMFPIKRKLINQRQYIQKK